MSFKKQRGLALVELLLVLALIGVVLAAGWNAFGLGQKAWRSLQTKLEAEAAVRLIGQIISHELNRASFLEIRDDTAPMWANADLQTGDRIIFVNSGNIILREITASGNTDTTIAAMDNGNLELVMTKRLNPTNANRPIANSLNFTVNARDNDARLVYSSASAIMLSNMLPNTGVPTTDISLYSRTDNCTPGTRILYRTTVDKFTPGSPPGGGFTCGW